MPVCQKYLLFRIIVWDLKAHVTDVYLGFRSENWSIKHVVRIAVAPQWGGLLEYESYSNAAIAWNCLAPSFGCQDAVYEASNS